MSEKKSELKPCPFCGGKELTVRNDLDGDGYWVVQCIDCICSCGWDEDKDLAIKIWNTRPESIALSELEKLIEKWKMFKFGNANIDIAVKNLQYLIDKGRESK